MALNLAPCSRWTLRDKAAAPVNSNVRPQNMHLPMARALWIPLFALLLVGTTRSAAPSILVLEKKVGHLYYYKGTVLLKGVAERRMDTETLELVGDNLCFFVSATSRNQIPRDRDERLAWFCFTERDTAIRTLRLPSTPAKGTCGYRMPATVVVGNYVANRQEAEVFDTASLLAVRHRGTLNSIPCE